jgi:hypothetical protein
MTANSKGTSLWHYGINYDRKSFMIQALGADSTKLNVAAITLATL